jgi:hypothetical protein
MMRRVKPASYSTDALTEIDQFFRKTVEWDVAQLWQGQRGVSPVKVGRRSGRVMADTALRGYRRGWKSRK